MSLTAPSTDHRAAVSALRDRLIGDVLVPGDPGFAVACAGWNLTYAHDPALIVIAGDVADIVDTMQAADANGWPVTIHATGHGVSRPADDGVLIVTSRLTSVSIDPDQFTATIACGAKWADVLGPAQEHGLAPLLGSSTDVGAVGYTLGGGMGWLGRRFGLASDSVLSFDVVLGDGRLVHASAADETELFWALRGAGPGSFGVVVSMTIELYPVATVYAGNLLYPVAMATDVVRRFRSWVLDIDHRLTSSVVVMNFPPIDAVPAPLRGQSFVIVRGCWTGDLAAGERLVDEWRAWRSPQIDMFAPMPFTAVDSISNDPVDPMPAMVTSEWFDVLSDEAIDVIVGATVPKPGYPPMLLFSELRHAGGAIRDNAQGTANAHSRTGEFLLEMVGAVVHPGFGDVLAGFLAANRAHLAPMVSGASSINFLEGEEKYARSAGAFGPAMQRLREVKRATDPGNRLSRSLRITPAHPAP